MGEMIAISEIAHCSINLVSGWAGEGYGEFERQLAANLGVVLPDNGRFVKAKGVCVAGFGQGRFLLLAKKMPLLDLGERGVVSDLSHARCGLSLSGERAEYVLNKGLAVDLGLAQCPVGSVLQSTIDHVGVWIFRRADQVFEIYVLTSFARSFEEWLNDAALEFVAD